MNTISTQHWNRIPASHRSLVGSSGSLLGMLLIGVIALYACLLVGGRSIDTGTDTSTYAYFYDALGAGWVQTRLEPGFVAISLAMRKLGLGLGAYQFMLFALMLGTAALATGVYHSAIGRPKGYAGFLAASLAFLFLSPMFVNASINAIRQGLAALPVFAALLAFQQRKWALFIVLGALACSLHYSSALFLLFAPVLLLPRRYLRVVALVAFVFYVTGFSSVLVRVLLPSLYSTVMEYTANQVTRSGVRIDFALFSIFWYVLALMLVPLVRAPVRDAIRNSTSVYMIMLLPFFSIGWGFFSNRYLLPAWLAASLIFAAILRFNRIGMIRHPLIIGAFLVVSTVVFTYYIRNNFVI